MPRIPAPGAASSTPWLLLVGALAFACLPPFLLFSGPYEAMWALPGTPVAGFVFWTIALTTVFLTAAYLVRGVETLFRTGLAVGETIVRPQLMSLPHALIVAAGALVVAGFLYGAPAWFASFIAPALPAAPPILEPAGRRWAMPLWSALPFLAAIGGWAAAVLLHRRARPAVASTPSVRDRLYVLFWNKLYVDEVYDACVVAPTLRIARGLAEHVERGLVDRTLNAVVSAAVFTALWLRRVLEGRGIDRAVLSTGTASMLTARWLGRVLEGRAIQGTVDRVSHQADVAGLFFQERELHTLQQHVLLVVAGLASLLALFYVVLQWG